MKRINQCTLFFTLLMFCPTAELFADWKVKEDPAKIKPETIEKVEIEVSKAFFGNELTAASQNGPFIACGSLAGNDGSIQVYDLKTKKSLGRITAKSATVSMTALSQDGKLFALAARDRGQSAIAIMDVAKNKQLQLFRESDAFGPNHMEFIDDSKLFVVFQTQGKCAYLYDVKTGKSIQTFRNNISQSSPLPGVSAGGKYVGTISDSELEIYDSETGSIAGKIEIPKNKGSHWAKSCSFSPNGKYVSVLCDQWGGPEVITFSMAKGEKVSQWKFENKSSLGFKSKMTWLPNSDGWMIANEYIADLATGNIVWDLPPANRNSENRIAVAMNHIVVYEDNNKQGMIKSIIKPLEDIQSAKKMDNDKGKNNKEGAAGEGANFGIGNQGDMKNARLSDTMQSELPAFQFDLSKAKTVDVPLGSPEWKVKIGPVPVNRAFAPRPVPLSASAGTIYSAFFSDPSSGRATVSSSLDGIGRRQSSHVFSFNSDATVETVDLKTGKAIGKFRMKSRGNIVAVDPEGATGLLMDEKERNRIDRIDLTNGKSLQSWKPYENENEKHVVSVFMLKNNHTLTVNAEGKIILWTFKNKEVVPVYVADVSSLNSCILSHDRQYLIGVQNNFIRFINAMTGESVGDLAPVKNLAANDRANRQSKNDHFFIQQLFDATQPLAISYTGEVLATIVKQKDETNNITQAIVLYDIKAGRIVDKPIKTYQPSVPKLKFLDDQNLMVNNDLYNFEVKKHVWTYTYGDSPRGISYLTPTGIDQRAWFVNGANQASSLTAFDLPEENAIAYIKKTVTAGKPILKKGSTVQSSWFWTLNAVLPGRKSKIHYSRK